jgi:Secretion system C-terminal sorting domain/Galactose oxidase, central domain
MNANRIILLIFLIIAVTLGQNQDFDERTTTGSGYTPPLSPFSLSGSWSMYNSSPMAVSRSCCAYVEISGVPYLYQFGGGNTSTELRRVARLNLQTNTWQNNYSTMPTQISSGTAITMNNNTEIYVFGGNDSPGSLGNTLKYNVLTNTWQTMADMPTAVTDALVVKFSESRIFIVGGGDGYFGTSTFLTNRVQIYNINTNTYSYSTNFPINIAMHGGGIYRDTIISVGGYTTGGNATGNCYKGVINPATLGITWTPMPSYPAGPILRMASYVAVKNTGVGIMCTGGAVGGNIPTAQTHFWNFCTQSWQSGLPNNSQARSNYKACGLGYDRIYMAGGYTNTGVGTTEVIIFSQIEGPCQNMVGINGNSNSIPERFELHQNYPNPFNPSTKISFSLPSSGFVKLEVYDLHGGLVRDLTSKTYSAGTHSIDFNASELPSGVYLYKIQAGNFTDSKRMVLIK